MLFLIILVTVAMVIDCLVLILLVLMQLPKKEAGAGLAFGGAATDALFGAGSGNFLTKATKWAGGIFFVLAISLALMQSHRAHSNQSNVERLMQQQQSQPAPIALPPATTPASTPSTPVVTPTNVATTPVEAPAPAAAPTNAAPAPQP